MTYEQFRDTMWHEGNCHGNESLPCGEITMNFRRQQYEVYCPVTDAEAAQSLREPDASFDTYDAAERGLYDLAIKNNLL